MGRIVVTGRRMFGADDARAALQLVDCGPTTTGVIIAGYRPAGGVR